METSAKEPGFAFQLTQRGPDPTCHTRQPIKSATIAPRWLENGVDHGAHFGWRRVHQHPGEHKRTKKGPIRLVDLRDIAGKADLAPYTALRRGGTVAFLVA